MAKIPQEAQELFAKVDAVVLATAREDGQPNVCMVGMKKILDDETIYLSDQFFKKTLENVQANPKVAIVFWKGTEAYELYGTARYVNEGEEFTSQKEWVDAAFEKMGLPIKAKGGCYVHIDEVFSSAPGPQAGIKLA